MDTAFPSVVVATYRVPVLVGDVGFRSPLFCPTGTYIQGGGFTVLRFPNRSFRLVGGSAYGGAMLSLRVEKEAAHCRRVDHAMNAVQPVPRKLDLLQVHVLLRWSFSVHVFDLSVSSRLLYVTVW